MYSVGTGRLIAERYTLNERHAHLGSIEVWAAIDATLGREVSVTVFPTNLSRADAIVDAARRRAALNDHRLVRVPERIGQQEAQEGRDPEARPADRRPGIGLLRELRRRTR